jgi:hypothetical protein
MNVILFKSTKSTAFNAPIFRNSQMPDSFMCKQMYCKIDMHVSFSRVSSVFINVFSSAHLKSKQRVGICIQWHRAIFLLEPIAAHTSTFFD